MSAADHLRDVLHLVSGALVWPVLAGLLLLAALILVALGSVLRQAWDRARGRLTDLDRDRAEIDAAASEPAGDRDIAIEAALQAAERRRWREVTRVRLAVRLGPALGLMGTLIPMAHALQGLADGNLPALASHMVTAFAATVVGLAISVIAFVLAAVRDGWVRRDLEVLTFHAERVARRAAGEMHP